MNECLLDNLNEAQREAVTSWRGAALDRGRCRHGKNDRFDEALRALFAVGDPSVGHGMPCAPRTENYPRADVYGKAAGEMEDRVINLMPTGTYDFLDIDVPRILPARP